MPLCPPCLQPLPNDKRGLVTVEFALMLGILVTILLNGIEAARWYYSKMQLDNATQMAAQALFKACGTAQLPATTNCTAATSTITTALQSSSLGTAVTLDSGFPTEQHYCVNTAGALVIVGTLTAPPSNCSSVGNGGQTPGDYVLIQSRYSYTPLFAAVSFGSLLPAQLTSTTMIRLN